jgi:hypothetical protein
MSRCECKAGFFALRDCSQPVLGRCPACRRNMCRRHSAIGHPLGHCLDCVARAQQTLPPTRNDKSAKAPPHQDQLVDTKVDDAWVYSYRNRFYAGGYAPIYAGTQQSSYYDSFDSRSFDQLQVERDDLGDDAGAGFGDS